jgi:hypothetical protein
MAARRKKIYVATLETRSYDFTSVGETEYQAREAIRLGWEEHLKGLREHAEKYYGGELDFYTWEELEDSCYVQGILVGDCIEGCSSLGVDAPKKGPKE